MSGRVVVVGAALMDVHAVSRRRLVLETSNPATISTSPGGVGRNIAENLARLGTAVDLVAVVGADAFGDALIDQARSVGIGTGEMITTPYPTGTYVAVLDADGELSVAASDATATDGLTVPMLVGARSALESAALLVLDGNLPPACVGWLLDVAAAASVPVVLEPVSVPKAERLAALLDTTRPILLLTPNRDELAALAAGPTRPLDRSGLGPGGDSSPDGGPAPGSAPGPTHREGTALDRAVGMLHDRGVRHVWVRQGAEGSTLHTAGSSPTVLPGRATTVVDVTGAGDAMTAGFVHALVEGATPSEAAAYGQAAAELTVASPHTVRPDLSDALVRGRREPDRGDPL
ncbi:Carbohydrate kinase, PfkB family protein [Nostocoides japonicum T1-X7]|uniref:Carbohydrate kinase, PfkB family protein n=1 Tax=Nostocoides japonicum T1-X7 TaxID=1194083 RepID=A0A077M8C4_9MICO|nr:carbohydrate kinase family protein [Tetrasphaera japonica]CCH80290.1 Carbohydrate kinase, PfkB family protein [Tetrasphaera japonica T1-X7]